MATPEKKKVKTKEPPSSPWNNTELTVGESNLFIPDVKYLKDKNGIERKVFLNVLNMETIDLQESVLGHGRDMKIYTLVKGLLPLRIVKYIDSKVDNMDTVVQVKSHGIDCVGNLVQVVFQDNKLLRSATKNVEWALDNCFISMPNGSKVASNEVYLFKHVRVHSVEDDKKKYKFSGNYLHEILPYPYHGGEGAEETDTYIPPEISMNATPILKIVRKELKLPEGVHPNIDVFGIIDDYKYDQHHEIPSIEDLFNMHLMDEKGNKIFVQAKGVYAFRLKKFVINLGGLYDGKHKIMGFRNLEYSHGAHRNNTDLMCFFFQKDSEPYDLKQLKQVYINGFNEFEEYYNKLYEKEEWMEEKHTQC